ncbi:hypothetical protein KIL84_004798, partial [Mauremys mutica]
MRQQTSADHVSHLLMERDQNDRFIAYRPETSSPSIRHNPTDKLRIKLNQSLERSIPLRHCHIPALGKPHSSGHLEAGGSNGNWFVNLTTAAAPATTPRDDAEGSSFTTLFSAGTNREPVSELSLLPQALPFLSPLCLAVGRCVPGALSSSPPAWAFCSHF